jgi:hypothetical protein
MGEQSFRRRFLLIIILTGIAMSDTPQLFAISLLDAFLAESSREFVSPVFDKTILFPPLFASPT